MSETIFFYIFAVISVGMVLLMIFQTNPIVSALYLVFGFFGVAGLYVLLSAPFVAVLQVLVYAGAIMVLFLFVLMLLNLRKEDLVYDRLNWRKIGVGGVAILFLGFLAHHFTRIQIQPFFDLPENFGTPEGVGRLLFTTYLIPFELVSILLLVAIIGAVVLGKRQ